MDRVVVYFYTESYANMEADLIVECDDCYKAFNGTELVGVFSCYDDRRVLAYRIAPSRSAHSS